MSLDVALVFPGEAQQTEPTERIFVRRNGATVEVTREQWDELYPGREPVTMVAEMDSCEVFTANITHNMTRMAGECGRLYEACWRPNEIGVTHARDLIEPLREGLAILSEDRERLQQFNPENGWGDYDLLVRFTVNYLAACERWPEAEVQVSA